MVESELGEQQQQAQATDSPSMTDPEDDFFERNGPNKKNSNSALQLAGYLNDPRTDLLMLNDYPSMKKVYIRRNAPIASSAPVERLFSAAGRVLGRRDNLSDDLFELLLLLKLNPFEF